MAIVSVALAIRLAYLLQIRTLPFVSHPGGDSGEYLRRAGEIMAGDWAGSGVPFLGSVLYPYFLAAVMSLPGGSLLYALIVQSVIGGLSCLLIGLLAREVYPDRWGELAAGMLAALYGPMVFLENDLVMSSLTAAAVAGGLLSLLKALRRGSVGWAFLSGLLLGAGSLDRANLLLFVPAAAWFLWRETARQRILVPVILVLGAVLPLMPFAINNLIRHGDLTITSSSLGVNFYIGNNPQAPGVFYLPEGSGLMSHDLFGSSKRLAEQQTGRTLKPSQVSTFWLKKGLAFIGENPAKAFRQTLRKMTLLLNHYEIPNHLNFYYIRKEFGPALWLGFVGFGIAGALGLAGLIYLLWDHRSPALRLCWLFLAVYLLSQAPFFAADRYRVPLLSPLLALAGSLVARGGRALLLRSWRKLAFLVLLASLAAWLVNQSLVAFPFSSDRIEVSRSYMERAMERGDPAGEDLRVALSGLKWALEASRPGDPWVPYGRFHLGRAYAFLGLYSYALSEFDRLQASGAADGPVAMAKLMVLEEYSRSGDVVGADIIPSTPFEEAESCLSMGDYQRARQLYRAILERDPFHYSAINRLGLVYYLSGKLEESLEVLTQGLRHYPDDRTMLENARQISVQLGRLSPAEDLMRRYGK